ncbi:tripartite tricarboxylate transporter TctB family protein [Aliiroseovarius marinus]|uniref:tripartite tricarboxylate transporter TctB family protein n=1 Tax=Aliiroseovarius marinus TaxID=2500159 RepID=UPI0024949652|nr:tripartite tricarboxylate transporter TctB family protein [Aliiroseovarius marinus]
MRNHSANTALGLGCIAFALILAFIWIPFDTDTGLVERSRGRYIVGDGLAPTMAAVFILISGVMLLLERGAENHHPNRHNMFFIGAIIACGVIGILLMRWTGPAITSVFGGEEYRLLRDTVPWKYMGFIVGGVVMIFGMIAFVEERLSWRALWIALAAVAGIILLYDVPFDDVLLPPNGDV